MSGPAVKALKTSLRADPVLRKVWHFGPDVDTDALAPGAYMQHDIDVVAQHCLENLNPQFATQVQKGDVIVAGPNFGIGSSREQAAAALVHLGVAAVIAPSYGGLFFRNAFNLGLLLLTCTHAAELQSDTQLAFSAEDQHIRRAHGLVLSTEPVPDFLLDMVRMGGLLPQLKHRLQNAQAVPKF